MPDKDQQANREFERLIFFNAVTLVLPSGQEIPGTATDMGHGGAFLELDYNLDSINVGDSVQLKIELFGRPSSFTAFVAHKRNNGIGLRLDRGK
ncbi:MAG: PilZ domain-containing protein [Magnetococcales bacterium]|nr:PilZ domain-containing protein [Magnetococcales bacterium]